MHQYQKYISDPKIPHLGISSKGKKNQKCVKNVWTRMFFAYLE